MIRPQPFGTPPTPPEKISKLFHLQSHTFISNETYFPSNYRAWSIIPSNLNFWHKNMISKKCFLCFEKNATLLALAATLLARTAMVLAHTATLLAIAAMVLALAAALWPLLPLGS